MDKLTRCYLADRVPVKEGLKIQENSNIEHNVIKWYSSRSKVEMIYNQMEQLIEERGESPTDITDDSQSRWLLWLYYSKYQKRWPCIRIITSVPLGHQVNHHRWLTESLTIVVCPLLLKVPKRVTLFPDNDLSPFGSPMFQLVSHQLNHHRWLTEPLTGVAVKIFAMKSIREMKRSPSKLEKKTNSQLPNSGNCPRWTEQKTPIARHNIFHWQLGRSSTEWRYERH